MRIEEYASKYNIFERSLRKWIEEDKERTFGKIETNILELQFNMESELERTWVFKSDKIHIELKDGYDKEYLNKIMEVLTNDK